MEEEFRQVLSDMDGDAVLLITGAPYSQTWGGVRVAWLDGAYALTPDLLREWAAAFIAAAEHLETEGA